MDLEDKIVKHLEMIQVVINRMAHCSFLLKGWAIALATAGLWISTKADDSYYILVLLVPTFLFWILDGFFLNQERLFRFLYDSVRENKETNFSMKTDYSKSNWIGVCFSRTLLIFYLGIVLMYFFGYCILGK